MSRDFTEPRNQNAARSNAVSLTSKHKFFNAIAFWILAGNYEPAINVALQNLNDPHLALLIARMLFANKDETAYHEVLQNKILPAVSSKFYSNVWEQHMILWLLRKPRDATQVFLKNDGDQNELSDAPEIHSFVSYLNENEIVTSVRSKQQTTTTITQPQASNIFASPLFDMSDMAEFYAQANGNQKKDDADDLKSAFEPKAYDIASKVVTDTDLMNLLRQSAVSLSRCGLLIHSLESIECVLQSEPQNDCLRQMQSSILWRFLCVRATVMEQSYQIQPEQVKDDFADLSARFPKFDALQTLNLLYGECALRGFEINSCNIPSGPTLTRLLIVLSRSISDLNNALSHRSDRIKVCQRIKALEFMTKWQNVVDDLGLIGKERRIAIAAIVGIAHCCIFIKMFGLNRYDILEEQLCKNNLSPNIDSILGWFNAKSLQRKQSDDGVNEEDEFEEYFDESDTLWTNEKCAHGPIELLALKIFRFVILSRFVFLWRKLLKKIGLHASHFIDLGTLYTQMSEWLLSLSANLENAHQTATLYCLQNKVENFDHIVSALKSGKDEEEEAEAALYDKLEVDKVAKYVCERMKLFRCDHEHKNKEKSDGMQQQQSHHLNEEDEDERIAIDNGNNLEHWYPPYDIFKIEGDLPASIAFNKCDNDWICIATNGGLREIDIDCSLRLRLRKESDRSQLMDAECDNFRDCLLRFEHIQSPQQTEIFGPSPFGGFGDKRHSKMSSVNTENVRPYPINPLLPRIALKRIPSFCPNASLSLNAMSTSSPSISANGLPPKLMMSDQRKPSQIYFSSLTVSDLSIGRTNEESKEENETLIPSKNALKKSASAQSQKNEIHAAVTNTLQSNLFFGFGSYTMNIVLFPYCLYVPSIATKQRLLSNTYRFYERVIFQQNAAQNQTGQSSKNLQITEKDESARNESYLVIASHPSLPLYLASNTTQIRLFHFMHQYPLAAFSLPSSSKSKKNKSNSSSKMSEEAHKKSSKTAAAASRSMSNLLNNEEEKIQKKVTSQSDYMTALKFNDFGNKICAISQNGNLYLWHFNVPRSIFRREFRAYFEQHCHDKFGADLVFVDGSACIATCGQSSNNQNVCIWDLLFNDRSRSLIRSYVCYQQNGANCIEYAQDLSALIVGGHKGIIQVFDKRLPSAIAKWEHHTSRIWKLSYCESSKELMVATLAGNLSVWDLRKLNVPKTNRVSASKSYSSLHHHSLPAESSKNQCIVNEWKLFQRKTFLNHPFGAASQLGYVASVGLTDAVWTNRGDILCSGSDGTVKYLRRKVKIHK